MIISPFMHSTWTKIASFRDRQSRALLWHILNQTAFIHSLLWCNPQYVLTLWEPAYDIFILRFRPKKQQFRLPYQRPSSSTDCARELFKGSDGSASLVDGTRKNFCGWGCGFFVSDVISEVVWGSFWLMLPGKIVYLIKNQTAYCNCKQQFF